jgi:hypothetical protein
MSVDDFSEEPTNAPHPPSKWVFRVSDDEPSTLSGSCPRAVITSERREPLLPPSSDDASGPELDSEPRTCTSTCTVFLNVVVLALALSLATGHSGAATPVLLLIFGVLYMAYFLMATISSTGEALRNCMTHAELADFVVRLRRARPVVTATVKCWHYEEQSWTETYTDSDGHTQSRIESSTHRETTHHAKEQWHYEGCRDVSGPPVYLPHVRAARVRITAALDFSGERSRAAFDEWREGFYSRNRQDERQDEECGFVVPGLPKGGVFIMLCNDSGVLFTPGMHMLAVLLCCAWLYELCVLRNVSKVRWQVVKQLHASTVQLGV